MERSYIIFTILLTASFCSAQQNLTKEQLEHTFSLESMSDQGLDTFHRYYLLHEETLKPLVSGGLYSIYDKPYHEKMNLIDSLFIEKLDQEDYDLIIAYWNKIQNSYTLYIEDISERYTAGRNCISPYIDSLKAIYLDQIEDTGSDFFENLEDEELKGYQEKLKKYRLSIPRLIDGLEKTRHHNDFIDSMAITNFNYYQSLFLQFPVCNHPLVRSMMDDIYEGIDLNYKKEPFIQSYLTFQTQLAAKIKDDCYDARYEYDYDLNQETDLKISILNAIFYYLLNFEK